MNNLLLYALIFVSGFALGFVLFPRNKTINVADDYVEIQKTKDNSKTKYRGGVFGWLKRDPKKKAARILKRKNKRLNL